MNLEKLHKAGNATTDIDIASDNKEETSNEHRFFKWPTIDIRKLLVQLRDRDWTITAVQV
ncbi:hypothetical protein WUBG_15213 [Wuchereria bancrofti]|nr:hypothetical protein WUBG_15213 [Wuchereria bancrofti]